MAERRRGVGLATALGMLAAIAAAPAPAAPRVSFAASRTERCVAPCAVFFDATETSDASTDEPFHALDFRWDFGDERGETWAVTGLPKNRAIGGIAGHLFTQPGHFTVTLAVANAAGERATASAVVVVDDPERVFAGEKTVCVSARGDFAGCPAGARQTKSGDFATSIANAPGRRTLFRRGESFALDRVVFFADARAAGSAIGAFGSGTEPATLRIAPGATLDAGDDWRVSHLALRGAGTTEAASGISEYKGVARFTLHDVTIGGFSTCVLFWSPSRPNEQVAVVDVRCGDFPEPGNGAKFGEDTQQSMFLGVEIDKGEHRDPADQTEFAWRTSFSSRKVIQHSRFRGRGPNQSKNLLQLRHCPTAGPWAARCPDGKTPSRYVIVSDNHFLEGGGPNAMTVVRVCDHGACTGAPGASQAVLDYVIERNLVQLDASMVASDQLQSVFQIQASRTSVRDNVADVQGWPHGGAKRAFFVLVDPLSNPARDGSGDVRVVRNTIHLGPGFPGSAVLCGARGAMPRLLCADNLFYAPGLGGSVVETFGEGWTARGNHVATSNPFAASPPERLRASLRDRAAFRTRDGVGARVADPLR